MLLKVNFLSYLIMFKSRAVRENLELWKILHKPDSLDVHYSMECLYSPAAGRDSVNPTNDLISFLTN